MKESIKQCLEEEEELKLQTKMVKIEDEQYVPLQVQPQKSELNTSKFPSNQPDEDSGWAWVVLATSFIASAILWGQVISFSIYFVILREVFHESRSTIAWIGSLNQASVNLFGIFSGIYLQRLGARGSCMIGGLIASVGYILCYFSTGIHYLFITYSLMVGGGFCLCFSASFAATGIYFKRHLFIAVSVCVTGGGFGIMFFSYLIEYMCDEYGWRGAFLIQGAITLNICASGATYFPRRRQVGDGQLRPVTTTAVDNVRTMSISERLRDSGVQILMIAGLLSGAALMSIWIVYKDLTLSKGFTQQIFDVTITALGAGNVAGRFLSGPIMSRMHPILYYVIITFGSSLIMFLMVISNNAVVFVVLGGLIGYAQGAYVCAIPNIVSYIYGRHQMAVTYGNVLFAAGLGLSIGGPMAGFIADVTDSYNMYLVVCGFLNAMVTLLIIRLYFINKRKLGRQRSTNMTVNA